MKYIKLKIKLLYSIQHSNKMNNNNPLLLIAIINTIDNFENNTKVNIEDFSIPKKRYDNYINKPIDNYKFKKKNKNRLINQPRNRGTNHIKAIRQNRLF